ncbi:Ig-like domain-containing protein, partial [Proteus mirabilis]|uniref:Ig-like domain-containing protein n=1 Tax=Proteus mirabilis TaxID=584 RepID=UPI001E505D16
ALVEGHYNFSVTAKDAAGNTSQPSEATGIIIDTQAPDAPFITSLGSPAVTNQPGLPISGTGEPGSTITLSNGGTVIGTAEVDSAGIWTITPDSPLTEGNYTLT